MKTNLRHRKSRFFTLALFLGISAIFIFIFLNANPAYASGSIWVSSYYEALDIRFVSATTNDSGIGNDPGQNQHVGQCTALLNKKSITFKIYSGYPGYECTLSVNLKNMSNQPIRLRRMQINTPQSLTIFPPVFPAGFILKPDEEVSLNFRVRIQQTAKENERYNFTVKLIMEASLR